MRLGLSLALTQPRGGASAPAVLDPATLALTGWWRAPYAGSPWTGIASDGTSGGRTIQNATPPSVGTALNGYDTADFDGSNDALSSADAVSTFVTTTAFSAYFLFKADSAGGADPGAATRYQGRTLASDSAAAGYLHFGHNAGGVYCSIYDGSYKSAIAACTPTNWTKMAVKFTGGTLSVRANGGSWATASITDIDAVTGLLYLGVGYGSAYLDGLIAEALFAQSAFDDSTFDGLDAYVLSRYGV